jgi:predicted nucleic acid-binding protein
MPVFIDTNILLYSVTDEPQYVDKRRIAGDIIDSEKCVLSVQVLQEFYVQATGSKRGFGMSEANAVALVGRWCRFPVMDMDARLMFRAFEIKSANKVSYWDAAIVAAAEVAGCNLLLTEDMNDGQLIADVRIKNPFINNL